MKTARIALAAVALAALAVAATFAVGGKEMAPDRPVHPARRIEAQQRCAARQGGAGQLLGDELHHLRQGNAAPDRDAPEIQGPRLRDAVGRDGLRPAGLRGQLRRDTQAAVPRDAGQHRRDREAVRQGPAHADPPSSSTRRARSSSGMWASRTFSSCTRCWRSCWPSRRDRTTPDLHPHVQPRAGHPARPCERPPGRPRLPGIQGETAHMSDNKMPPASAAVVLAPKPIISRTVAPDLSTPTARRRALTVSSAPTTCASSPTR